MRILIAVLFVFFFSNSAHAQEIDCTNTQDTSQLAMNVCSFQAWEEADLELNKIWQLVKSAVKDLDNDTREFSPDQANAEDNLLKAQRAWINYRDGHCDTIGAQFTGGTIQPLVINTCLEDLTRTRIKELNEFIMER